MTSVASGHTPAVGSAVAPRLTGSVLICCYTADRWGDLLAAIESVLVQRPAPLEVVVVVDHNDYLLRRLEVTRQQSWADRPVRVLASTHSPGLSGARNTGLAQVIGDVVVFLDDDARARPGWFATHLAAYAEPRVLGVGGRLEPRWDTGRPGWFPHDFDWVIGCTHSGVPESAAPIRNPIGANMSFRADLIRAVGGFSEDLGRVGTVPLGCEETEASIRVGDARPDGDVWYLPDAVVEHRVSAGRARWSYFWHRCVSEGRSKAVVRRLSAQPLGTERDYATRILPRSFGRALTSALRGDRSGPARAGAIVAGLGLTAYGFLLGTAADAVSAHRTPAT